ncbi:cell division protein SepF [Micromonospora sp. LAH09]|uniref:cell division protein SepF n=1 Tax=Micromonospora cabrerizensis TaxID=2911213 RepID=UPI001EE9A20C|nr:cell division protein SepF [Micromonospora cabrerizensis]MCG5470955.1 cell division protein SepF [Micromonospora cabrerizensis]
MGALRKAGVWLGLVEEDDERAYDDGGYDKGGYRDSRYRQSRYAEEFADEDEDDTEEPPAPRPRVSERGRLSERASGRLSESERGDGERPERVERASVRSITRSTAGETSGALTYHTRDNLALAPQVTSRERALPEEEQRYQITTLHPTTYREARTIGEHFRDGVPVIINLTEMDEADARRLVDFAAGLAFGLRGTIERVTNRVFLLSPANVQVTAEDKAKIAEGGFFSLS